MKREGDKKHRVVELERKVRFENGTGGIRDTVTWKGKKCVVDDVGSWTEKCDTRRKKRSRGLWS